MFRKAIITLCIQSFLFTTSYAQTASAGKIQDAYDQLTYSLTVSPQSSDVKFQQDAVQKFEADITALQAQGVSEQEILDYTLAQVTDAEAKVMMADAITKAKAGSLSNAELSKTISLAMEKSKKEGAHWLSPEGTVFAALIVIGAGLAIYTLFLSKDAKKNNKKTENCNDYGIGFEFMSNPFCVF